jgi:hypothetical protein
MGRFYSTNTFLDNMSRAAFNQTSRIENEIGRFGVTQKHSLSATMSNKKH